MTRGRISAALRRAVVERAGGRCEYCIDGPSIAPLSAVGRVTVAILRLNHPDRVREREALLAIDMYP
jgi:hypothetical protein